MDLGLLALLPVGVVLRSGDRLTPNPAAEEMTGYAPSDIETLDLWFDRLFGKDAACRRQAYDHHRAAGFPGPLTWVMRHRDGSRRVVDFVARLLPDGDEVWTLHDITDRHQADERFRVLFEHSTDAHLLFDQTGIIDCNPAAVAMLRCRDKEQLLATHPAVFSPERQPDGKTSLEKSVEMDGLARRNGFHRFDWVHRKLDGTDFPVEVTLNPVVLPTGPALLVVWHDLTARKETERALAEARDRAVAGTRAKSVFLANMSHELRTPLNAIIGYAEMLADEGQGLADGDLAKISNAGHHLLALINDVLDLSKIEAGHVTLASEWVDVAAVAMRVAQTLGSLAKANGNELQVAIEGPVGHIHGDATRLHQVLLNLMGNANKFTAGGTVRLSVQRATEDGVDWVHFQVVDNGIGIAPHMLPRIFDEFVQGDASTTRRYGGTGLGLAITRRVCHLMGGTVSATSTLGEGSQFRVSLPADDSSGQALAQLHPHKLCGAKVYE